MQAVPPSAAAMPMGSHTVRGDNNKTPMPATPSTLAPKRQAGRAAPFHAPGQAHHQQRLDGAHHGRQAARQAVGGDEQQRLEHADIERGKNQHAAPVAPRWQAPHQQQQQQAGRQHADQGRGEGTVAAAAVRT